MATTLGTGAYRYAPLPGWARLPAELELGEVAGLAIDRQDRIFVFNRGPNPMIVLDRDGAVLTSWGHGLFRRPHGVHIGPDDSVYCTDEGSHTLCKCSPTGQLLLRLGLPDRPAPAMSCRPFNRCTHSALAPNGDIYVSDGYGNAAIHRFAPDGRWLSSWGAPGTDPGQFNLPHNIHCDANGMVYVADRENHRIQIFDGDGRYAGQWNNLHRPSALFMTAGPCPLCYVGEIGPYLAVNRDTPNLGPRVTILADGKRLGRLDSLDGPGTGAAQFTSPHAIAVDSHGDLYVGEVTASAWPSLFPGRPLPAALNPLKKFARLPPAADAPTTP